MGSLIRKKGLMQIQNLTTACLIHEMNLGLIQMDLVPLPVKHPWKVKTPLPPPQILMSDKLLLVVVASLLVQNLCTIEDTKVFCKYSSSGGHFFCQNVIWLFGLNPLMVNFQDQGSLELDSIQLHPFSVHQPNRGVKWMWNMYLPTCIT